MAGVLLAQARPAMSFLRVPRGVYCSLHARTRFETVGRISRQNAFHTSRKALSQQDADDSAAAGSGTPDKPPKSPEVIIKEHVQAIDHLLRASEMTSYPSLNVYNIKAANVGYIKLIAFNTPKNLNAISKQLQHDLSEQIEAIHAETHAGETRAVILASEVNNAFCAGADLAERKAMSPKEVMEFLNKIRYTFQRIADLPIPSISCVSGYALGGGLELALCTHLRVFGWNAQVGLPETRLAIIPGAGGTYRLPQVIGVAKARELILDARRLKGREAYDMGLCNRVVESTSTAVDENDPELAKKLTLLETVNWAMSISRQGPIAIRAAIQALKYGGSVDDERAAYERVMATTDRLEALAAFAEKRAPQFKGE